MLSPLPQLIFFSISNLETCPLILQEGEAIVYATLAMTPLFGYTNTELLALPALSLAAPHERQRIRSHADARVHGAAFDQSLHYQATGLHKDGHFLHNLVITVCTYPQEPTAPVRRIVYFEEESQENLYQFSLDAAEVIHGWNRATLRAMAADIVQQHTQELELRIEALEAELRAQEQRRLWWRQHRAKLLTAGATGAAVIVQEVLSGTGKRLLESLWRVLGGK